MSLRILGTLTFMSSQLKTGLRVWYRFAQQIISTIVARGLQQYWSFPLFSQRRSAMQCIIHVEKTLPRYRLQRVTRGRTRKIILIEPMRDKQVLFFTNQMSVYVCDSRIRGKWVFFYNTSSSVYVLVDNGTPYYFADIQCHIVEVTLQLVTANFTMHARPTKCQDGTL